MNFKIGFLNIGQSPRDDIFSEIKPILSLSGSIVQAGALDSLEGKEIALLKPREEEIHLITRLRDGQAVMVSREKIKPLLQAKIENLEKEGADVIALLCTEDFSDLVSSKKLLLPFNLMKEEVLKLRPSGLIVFIPMEEQRKMAETRWLIPETELFIEILNPYKNRFNLNQLKAKSARRKNFLIIFDCLGYSISLAQSISRKLSLPYLSPRLLLAREINHLISKI